MTAETAPETVLDEAQRLVHGPRQHDYGHPLDNFTAIAGAASSVFAAKLKEPLTAEDAALFLVLVKVCRQAHCPKRDNLTDIAGYAAVIEMIERKRAMRKAQALAAD